MQTRKIPLTPEDAKNLDSIERSIQARSVEFGRMSIQLREMESGLAKLYDFRRDIIQRSLNEAGISKDVRAHVTQTGPSELTIAFLDDSNENENAEPLNSESG